MPTVTIGHHPELTAKAAMEVFQRHFADKYDVYEVKLVLRDFVIKKSGWMGYAVALKQRKDSTFFVFNAYQPSALVQFLQVTVIGWLFTWFLRRPTWKAMEREIKSFIENAPEFK